MNRLTPFGWINILIFLCSIVVLAIGLMNGLLFACLVGFIILCIWCSVQLSARKILTNRVADTILGSINFSLTTELELYSTAMQDYTFSHLWYTQIRGIYNNTEQTYPFTLIRFTLTEKIGKYAITSSYIGCEFTTKLNHEPVQLYDKNNPIQPTPKKDIQLESNEFNNLFNLYSSKPSAPFYFLDPDTMSDLIDLRNDTGVSINMESVGNRIFIYMDDTEFFDVIDSDISSSDILNWQIHPDKIKRYQSDMQDFIGQIQRIFETLDYKLKID